MARAEAPRHRSHSHSGRPLRLPLIGSLRLGLPQQRPGLLPFLGTICVLAAAALINWVIAPLGVISSAREGAVETLGVGIFAVIALMLIVGLWLITGARWRPGNDGWRRIMGLLALALFACGIAGMIQPEETLGGVDLARVTAGGDLGDALTSPGGAFIMLLLAVSAALLLAPRLSVQTGLMTLHVLSTIAAGQPLRLSPTAWRHGFITTRESFDCEELEPASAPAEAGSAADARTGGLPKQDDDVPINDTAEIPPGSIPTEIADSAAVSASSKRRLSDDGWQLPPLSLLRTDAAPERSARSREQAQQITKTLTSFGVDSKVVHINEGPAVTQFGIEPGWEVKLRTVVERDEQGRALANADGQPRTHEEEVSRTRVRVNKITRLANDLALALAAQSIRVEAPIPGKPVVGIEVPNDKTRLVSLRGVLESPEYKRAVREAAVPIALGRNVAGRAEVQDLARMPHLLIAGATGSGKSVAINSIICGLLMQFSPAQLRLVLVDPKRVELTNYADIPHLAFSRVVTEPDEMVGVLSVVVTEMDRRYRRFERAGERNIASYNASNPPDGTLPHWVVIIDELADLMMAAPVDVEQQLVRLAQLARATGIFLVIATQRPSVDVVTGLIKANFPTRMAFATTSQTDSRVILDRAGAEKLVGRGDMLFQATDSLQPRRVQGTYVSDEEIERVIDFWTLGRAKAKDHSQLDEQLQEAAAQATLGAQTAVGDDPRDSLYAQARALAQEHTRVSASMLQRRLRIGYPRAARLIDALEAAGVIKQAEEGQSREVVATVESESH